MEDSAVAVNVGKNRITNTAGLLPFHFVFHRFDGSNRRKETNSEGDVLRLSVNILPEYKLKAYEHITNGPPFYCLPTLSLTRRLLSRMLCCIFFCMAGNFLAI